MALIYLLLFAAPQVLVYLYLRERLPTVTRPERAAWVRRGLAAVFLLFNFPWIFFLRRILFGSVWGRGEIPLIGPWVAWQMMGWVFCGLVAVYLLMKGMWWLWHTVRRTRYAVTSGSDATTAEAGQAPSATAHRGPRTLSRRQFLARATYTYAATGAAVGGYGIWNADRLPEVTRRTLWFPNLPPGLDGIRILHLSDVHAGAYMEREKMERLVAQANALAPDLVLQTGDLIDISPAYIPDYVRAFRELRAPLGVVTCLGNHDHYTGAAAVERGARDAGQTVLRVGTHVVEHGATPLALVAVDDPQDWEFDDPQTADVDDALRGAPPEAFKIMLAHRPGAWDGAAPRGVPLTLSGHIHGGQFYLPVVGWSAGRLITKYVMGHFQRGESQLYVSRGIGVVGVPIRIFVPPEIALLELRRGRAPAV
jgi:predicted MPP superfamily phosphohydrolase